MNLVTDIVELDVLIATIRALAFGDNMLANWLPNVQVEDIDYRYATVERANRAAQIRAYDTPARIGRRPGVTDRRGSLPPISEILPLSESERIRLRRLRGGAADTIRQSVYADAAIGAASVANRVEMLRGEALSTGQVNIDEGGVTQVVNYGLPVDHLETAADDWTNVSTANILEELLGWRQTYIDNAGAPPGVIVTSTRVQGLMLRNAAIRGLMSVGGTVPSIATVTGFNQLLQAHGLPPVVTYDRQVEDATGTLQRVIPESRLIMLPGSPDAAERVGETQHGVTEEAVTLTERQIIDADDAPGVVAVTLQSDEPIQTATKVATIALPVIRQPERVFSAEVFSES